jgi:hypothetical protein
MPEAHLLVKALLQERVPEVARLLERGEVDVVAPRSVGFRALFASVPRRLGAAATQTLGEGRAQLPVSRPHWTLTDLARLWLLLRGCAVVPAPEHAGWVLWLFEAGEIGEQVSILRTLSALPEPGRFVETGEQACRHNSLDVFAAIVAENPFLAEHFPAPSFNQAVMKALFLQLPLARLEQLERRITKELSRMAAGYASERRAAGRSVSDDATYLSQYGAK